MAKLPDHLKFVQTNAQVLDQIICGCGVHHEVTAFCMVLA
jgi:hypothetical protein